MSEQPTKKRRSSQGGKKGNKKKQIKVITIDNSDADVFEAENIEDARLSKKGLWEYRVRWKGYAPSDDTWEPARNLNPAMLEIAKIVKRRVLGKQKDDPAVAKKEEPKEPEVSKNYEEESSDDDEIMILGVKEDEASMSEAAEPSKDHWEWTEKELVNFREIERIDVNHADAHRRVTEARENGVPVCLIGHKGWTNFAKRWLKKRSQAQPEVASRKSADKDPGAKVIESSPHSQPTAQIGTPELTGHVEPSNETFEKDRKMAVAEPSNATEIIEIDLDASNHGAETQVVGGAQVGESASFHKDPPKVVGASGSPDHVINLEQDTCSVLKPTEPTEEGWLDLTELWEVDVDKMLQDIGNENVPVVRPKYNEQEPIHAVIPLWQFLKRCWPLEGEESPTQLKSKQMQYLHQWQFPLSETARPKLCGSDSHNPLPNDIFGEDLLDCWQDDGRGNPYEYIFMGRDQTLSKMHRDPGGLAISIAPIVGNKEVVLVHRSDGYSCLSHLQASLEKINLHKYPLLPHARIYKSTIKPGEILLMPQGTFHQCRNVTPCLSYSRFHLDTVNLRAFFESWVNGDAPEMPHENVIWNASKELSDQLDKYVDELRASKVTEEQLPLSMIRKVDSLRALWGISRAVALRFENGGGGALWRPEAAGFDQSGEEQLSAKEEAKRWNNLVKDIEGSLHYFQYRNKAQQPPFRSGYYKPVQRLKTPMEKALEELPVVSNQIPCLLNTELRAGTAVAVNFRGRRVEGVVKSIEADMPTAFLHFDDLPDAYDEYIPTKILKVPVAGEAFVDGHPENITPGKVVVYNYGPQEYRAIVKFCLQDSFVLLKLDIGSEQFERWLPRSSVLTTAGNAPGSSETTFVSC